MNRHTDRAHHEPQTPSPSILPPNIQDDKKHPVWSYAVYATIDATHRLILSLSGCLPRHLKTINIRALCHTHLSYCHIENDSQNDR